LKVLDSLTEGENYPTLSAIPQLVDELEEILEELGTSAASDLQAVLIRRTAYIWSTQIDVSLPILAAFFNPNFNHLSYKRVLTTLIYRLAKLCATSFASA